MVNNWNSRSVWRSWSLLTGTTRRLFQVVGYWVHGAETNYTTSMLHGFGFLLLNGFQRLSFEPSQAAPVFFNGFGIEGTTAIVDSNMNSMQQPESAQESVLEIHAKVFKEKVSSTTHLLLENLDKEGLRVLRAALPFYSFFVTQIRWIFQLFFWWTAWIFRWTEQSTCISLSLYFLWGRNMYRQTLLYQSGIASQKIFQQSESWVLGIEKPTCPTALNPKKLTSAN